jgi:hypothetical protein
MSRLIITEQLQTIHARHADVGEGSDQPCLEQSSDDYQTAIDLAIYGMPCDPILWANAGSRGEQSDHGIAGLLP